MWDIHRTSATWLVRRAARAPAFRPRHRNHSRPRLTLEPLEERALLSTWTVNSLGDSGTGTGQAGDLRYCITQANQTPGDNTINFAVDGITLNSALPDLSNTTGLTDIEGPAYVASSDFRIFTVDANVQAKIVGLRITGQGSPSGNYYGGGISNDGTLTVIDSNIDNSGSLDSYIGNSGSLGNGGGIYNTGTLTVASSTIDNNSAYSDGFASTYGGGIYNTGTLTITGSDISGNSAINYPYVHHGVASYGGGIYNTGTVNLDHCTLSSNVAVGQDGSFSAPGGDAFGGAIYSTGDLALDRCTVSGNSAEGGTGYQDEFYAGLQAAGIASGGGLYVGLGAVRINGSSIEGNSALGGGALPYDSPGPGGSASGGGLAVEGYATAWISQSSISANSALGGNAADGDTRGYKGIVWGLAGDGGSASGGGLYFGGTSLTLTDSSVVQNRANGGRGGNGKIEFDFTWNGPTAPPYASVAGNGGSGTGGGLADYGSQCDLVNDTIYGNSVTGSPGGSGTYSYWAYDDQGNLQFFVVPFVGSDGEGTGGGLAGAGLLDNSLVALNTSGTGAPNDIGGGVSPTSAHNLIGMGGSGGLVNGDNGNQVGVANPGLDPNGLQNNGGPTQTIALVTGSPAIDAGSNALAVDPSTGQPLTTDQRGTGFPRIANGTVDIGAYEVQSYIATVGAGWGTRTAALQTASDGLRLLPAGRNTDLPWLGINQVQINLSQPAALAAGDITVIGSSGTNYGPVSISGSGTSYTITLAQAINRPDRVTITIGNDQIASFTRRLDVLPGDLNDDGVVNSQDMVDARNQIQGMIGALPALFGDINGDGKVDINDYLAVRRLIGTHL